MTAAWFLQPRHLSAFYRLGQGYDPNLGLCLFLKSVFHLCVCCSTALVLALALGLDSDLCQLNVGTPFQIPVALGTYSLNRWVGRCFFEQLATEPLQLVCAFISIITSAAVRGARGNYTHGFHAGVSTLKASHFIILKQPKPISSPLMGINNSLAIHAAPVIKKEIPTSGIGKLNKHRADGHYAKTDGILYGVTCSKASTKKVKPLASWYGIFSLC